MAFRHHPDRGAKGAQAEEMMKQLNAAYKLLIDYVSNYSYSFREDDVARAYPYGEYLKKFHNG